MKIIVNLGGTKKALALVVVAFAYFYASSGCDRSPNAPQTKRQEVSSKPTLTKVSEAQDNTLIVEGDRFFPVGFWSGNPYIDDDMLFLRNENVFNCLVCSIGDIDKQWDPGTSYGTNPQLPDSVQIGGWDSRNPPYQAVLNASDQDPYLLVGFPQTDLVDQPMELYQAFQNVSRIIGWWTFNEPKLENQVAWSDTFMQQKSGSNRVWGPVHYGFEYYKGLTPSGPAQRKSGHALLMVDIYNYKHTGDVAQKVTNDAGSRVPIIWLSVASRHWNERKYLEYNFWTSIVHGAKGIIWYKEDLLQNVFSANSPEEGNPYDGRGKFHNTIGERLRELVNNFINWGIRDAVLESRPDYSSNTDNFKRLNFTNTQFHGEPEYNGWHSCLAYDLNGRIFQTGSGTWYVVVVNDSPKDGDRGIFDSEHNGWARFRVHGVPGNKLDVTMVDGNSLNNFGLQRETNYVEIETYLNWMGYRIFKLEQTS